MSDTPRTPEANEASDGLRCTIDRLQRELAEARAECEKLRKDAERWRYWRAHPDKWNWASTFCYEWKSPEQLDSDTDAAIDAARKP